MITKMYLNSLTWIYKRLISFEFNGERYPDQNLELNFTQNRYAAGYQMMVDFYKKVMGMEGCTIGLENYKDTYPLLVFDSVDKLKD